MKSFITWLQFIILAFFIERGPLQFGIHYLVILPLLVPAILAAVKQGKFIRFTPTPAQESVLLTDGIYKYIRHPMYFSLLFSCLCVLIFDFSIMRVVNFLALAVVLAIKIRIEEALLQEKFPKYHEYKSRTKAIFPWIF
ncbi:MAG: hypothetical protein OHK0056_21330 [Bacteriovoracaceae bacterium]